MVWDHLMPSQTVELAVLDTSIYIENFRTGRFTERIVESPFLIRGISVVIHELLLRRAWCHRRMGTTSVCRGSSVTMASVSLT